MFTTMKCMKCLLALLTTILMVIGLALVAGLAYMKIKYSHLDTITGSQLIDIIIVAIAAFLVLVALLGFCGAATRNSALLKGFIFFVVLLLAVKVAVIVLLFVQQNEIRPTLTKLWNNANDESRIEFQGVFSCCDINNNTVTHPSRNDPTCFVGGDVHGKRKEGCVVAVLALWNKHMILGVAVVAVVLFTEFMIIVLSCMLLSYDGDQHDSGGGRGFRDTRRVHPMTVNVQGRPPEGDGYGYDTPDIPMSNAERRKWAKHNERPREEMSR